MEWRHMEGTFSQWRGDIIIFYAWQDEEAPLSGFARWMNSQAPWLKDGRALKDFRAKKAELLLLYAPAEEPVARLLLVGLGKRKDWTLESFRHATAMAVRRCRDLAVERVLLSTAALEDLPESEETLVREALMAATLGLYRYEALKTRDVEKSDFPRELAVCSEGPLPYWPRIVQEGKAVCEGIVLARDLATAPANVVTPSHMAQAAARIASHHGMRYEVVDLDRAKELGMGGFVAVAQGSREPARFIILEHCPQGLENQPPFVLVGKGITFDTGGISIKPAAKMEEMKHDMAGAATVLGTMDAIGHLHIPRRVLALMPCTENMPDGRAYKPGDVVTTHAGLTVEVISTDAEGRMILCDALSYAKQFEPVAMVDLATLTGACVIALGDRVAGLLGNHEGFMRAIQEIGTPLGELFWPLPLYDFYFEDIKSDVADIKNVGNRKAGTIIGAMFLKQFVPDTVPWAHVDIAGTVWADKDLGWIPKGATGFGVRTLVSLVQTWKATKEVER
ncbi:leucyl aminopeptidase [Desulfosoma caldarium]|uniref:Probable cytosol aminopeptidase n=1 Tax=Desulfosoma caldarium TaxID=610254 RepID=A0A3N1UVU3_9BACT|nr:leucyl aminopeptidase [Desulfosoma caldarium]ROQ92031.1 leucyl aminopeptidase [Desulfosoma caldarium]